VGDDVLSQRCTVRAADAGPHNEGPCTTTENTDGSSGLYSTPADMAKWLRYLAGPSTPAWAAQSDAAHAVYKLTSSLKQIFGLNHAGKPAGIGLGWMHLVRTTILRTSSRRPAAEPGSRPTSLFTRQATLRFLSPPPTARHARRTALRTNLQIGRGFSALRRMDCWRCGPAATAGKASEENSAASQCHGAAPVHARRPVANEHSARAAQPRAAKSTPSAQ